MSLQVEPTIANLEQRLERGAQGVRRAQRAYGSCRGDERSKVLWRLAQILDTRRPEILQANAQDMDTARREGLATPLLRRLELTSAKLTGLRQGVEQLAAAPDPLGEVMRRTELDDGLMLTQVKSPLGVLLIIFESRPDAVVQIGSLALRSGNGVLLKGGSEARRSNRVLVSCLRQALADQGHDEELVLGVEGRQAVQTLLDLDSLIDLVIPRGSGDLVRAIQSSTRIPVLGHAEGVCHLLIDEAADPAMATHLVVDSKCGYPAACNAMETLLVHQGFLPNLAAVARVLVENGVELRADERSLTYLEELGAVAATEEDWGQEFGDLILAVATVDGLDAAIDHIHRHGSGHTESVVTENPAVGERFLQQVDAASVFVNASTRFADGYRYGLGAEVGISTGRIHARGPVGVEGLLTSRWLLRGQGQAAGDYGPEGRRFVHRRLDPVASV